MSDTDAEVLNCIQTGAVFLKLKPELGFAIEA
jgi:hypothetical protein